MPSRCMQNRAWGVVGGCFSAIVCIVMITAVSRAGASNTSRNLSDWEGRRTNSILLNGDWEFSPGDGSEQAESPDGANRLHWQAVTLPGPFMPWSQEAANQTKFVWARRSFKVTPAQAQGLAVLRWNRIACGAAAFINGQKVGENEPTGPFQVIVPAGVLQTRRQPDRAQDPRRRGRAQEPQRPCLDPGRLRRGDAGGDG